MQMNKHKHTRFSPVLLFGLVLLAWTFVAPALTGADNERPEPVQAETEADRQAPVNEAADAAEKQPEADQVEAEPVTEFKPSEQIGADSAVAFPIDI
jgi:uncharacterized membrane protein